MLRDILTRHLAGVRSSGLQIAERSAKVQGIMVTPYSSGSPIYPPAKFYIRDFLELYGEGDIASCWVFACTRRIAQDFAQIPIQLFRGDKEVEKHPILDLFHDINQEQSYHDYQEAFATYMMLAGNCFIELAELQGKTPRELWLIRPDVMRIIPNKDGTVKGYVADYGGKPVPYLPEEILHERFFCPTNFYWGMPPLSAGRQGILTDYYARQANKNFFVHGMRPSGVLVIQGETSQGQRERIKEELVEAFSGYKQHQRPFVVEGDKAEWKDSHVSQKDAEFQALLRMGKEEVCAMLGVPPILIQDLRDASVLANTDNQIKSYWRNTILPFLRKIENFYTEWLVPLFPNSSGLNLSFNASVIEALHEDEGPKVEKAVKLVTNGIKTINQVRDEYWEDPPVSWGDVWWAPVNLVPVSGPGDGNSANQAKPEKQLKAANDRGQTDAERRRTALWELRARPTEPIETRFTAALQRFFDRQGKEMIALLRSMKGEEAPEERRISLARLLAKLEEDIEKLQETGDPHIRQAVIAGIEAAFAGYDLDVDLDDSSPSILRFVKRQGLQYAKNVTETSREILADLLAEGINAGESIPQLAERLTSAYEEFSAVRAFRIARTETVGASNFGIDEAYAQNARLLDGKEWVSSRDSRVRDSHTTVDGKVVPINGTFSVGGCSLKYPGDQASGCPGELINCRCTTIPVLKKKP